MNQTIVCDKCYHEGCTVSEVVPKSLLISMTAFARKGKSPYNLDNLYQQSEQRDRKWEIECPACGHTKGYTEHANYPTPRWNVPS